MEPEKNSSDSKEDKGRTIGDLLEANGLSGWAKTFANITAVGVALFLVISGQERIWQEHRYTQEAHREEFRRASESHREELRLFREELVKERMHDERMHDRAFNSLVQQQESLRSALTIIAEVQREIARIKDGKK